MFLSLSSLLGHLDVLLILTLAVCCKLKNVLNKAISILNFANFSSKFNPGYMLHISYMYLAVKLCKPPVTSTERSYAVVLLLVKYCYVTELAGPEYG